MRNGQRVIWGLIGAFSSGSKRSLPQLPYGALRNSGGLPGETDEMHHAAAMDPLSRHTFRAPSMACDRRASARSVSRSANGKLVDASTSAVGFWPGLDARQSVHASTPS